MQQDKSKLIDKIKKLLALSQSSNMHEASIALQKAQELMQEHQISNIHLIPEETMTHSPLEQNIVGQHYIWAKTLAYACAKMFDCTTLNYQREETFRFIGEEHNIYCAQTLFWHLFKTWKTLCNLDYKRDKPADRKLYRKSHGLGYAAEVWRRVKALTEKRHENIVKSTGTDLVVVTDSKLSDYVDNNFQTREVKSRALTTSSSGLMQGTLAGKKVNLTNPIEKKNVRPITSS